tara:strand:- start:1748 stop:2482 length:735 start_codon:yes stop_codon:yes gene_type:complete
MKIIRNNKSFSVTDFKIIEKYSYTKLSRNDESVRTYNVLKKKVPSVTTILQATQSKEKKESLRKWRERVGEEEASRITNQASARGTEMHYVLEQYLNGIGYLNLSKDGSLPRMMAHTIIDNLDQFSQVWGTEVTLHYKDLFAGSCDLVGVFENQPAILDFKQSNKPKKEEWIDDYFYQLAAYIIAHEDLYGKITKGVVLICTKDLVFQKFTISGERLQKYKEGWLKRVDLFHNLPNSLGETINT